LLESLAELGTRCDGLAGQGADAPVCGGFVLTEFVWADIGESDQLERVPKVSPLGFTLARFAPNDKKHP
jgi:hypothetical protein